MNYKHLIKTLIDIYNDGEITRKLTKEKKELIKETIKNKEKFIRYFRRMLEIDEKGDIFEAIKMKYGEKEDYFYPEQMEKEKGLLIKNVAGLLKDKWDYPPQLKTKC